MKFSKEIQYYREKISKGEYGLMPVVSNKIQIVWVHKCGYGRTATLTVNKQGRKEFEEIEKECKRRCEESEEEK